MKHEKSYLVENGFQYQEILQIMQGFERVLQQRELTIRQVLYNHIILLFFISRYLILLRNILIWNAKS